MERWQAILAVVFFVACLGVASRWLWGAIRGARGFLLGFQDAWERGRWFGEGERELEDYAIRG